MVAAGRDAQLGQNLETVRQILGQSKKLWDDCKILDSQMSGKSRTVASIVFTSLFTAFMSPRFSAMFFSRLVISSKISSLISVLSSAMTFPANNVNENAENMK